MSVEQLFTRLREGTKQQRHLRAAKLLAIASLLSALTAIVYFMTKYWMFGVMYVCFSVMWSCLAFAQYTQSRKASGE